MKLRKSKKGFTVVELVIVIAVIAVLAAILIPTFISLDSRAKKASDQSLVKNLNTALRSQEGEDGEKNATMHDAVLDLEKWGYKLSALVTKSGEDLLWNSKENQFVLSKDAPKADVSYWKIQDNYAGETAYSVYAADGFKQTAVANLQVGFDAGYNTGITSVEYKGSQDVVIRTNSFDSTLVVETDNSVTHYGEVGLINVKKVALQSFHEKGSARVVKLQQGNFEIDAEGKVSVITVTASDSNAAKVKVDGSVTTIVANEGVAITGQNAVQPVQLEAGSCDLADAVAIKDNVAISELPSSLSSGTLILLVDTNNEMTITGGKVIGNNTKLSAQISGSGAVEFDDIYTTGLRAQGFVGTITFDGGILDNGGRGTADEDAAIYLNSACTATFKNMKIAASLTKGIKASNVANITIDNCEFDATKLTIAINGQNSDLQSLSLVDIQTTNNVGTNITIKNSVFKGAPQGATAVPEMVSSSKNLADSDTGAAIKIKAEKAYTLGYVEISNNKFVDNYRDIVVGTAAYADKFNSTDATKRCPEGLCANNKIDSWTISNNTTTLSKETIENRPVATLSHDAMSGFNKFTTAADKCGELKGGVGVWVIANCYEKVDSTWYYLRNGVRHTVSDNAGVVTLTPVA